MTTTIVVILVTDMFLQRSSVIPFADLKFLEKDKWTLRLLDVHY